MPDIGLYLHIPFCAAKCPYCNFYSVAANSAAVDAYLAAVGRALDHLPWNDLQADTLYLGGGTPSLLGADRLARLLEAVTARVPLAPGAEVTLEANPLAVPPGGWRALRRAGYNRLSFGVQSLRPNELARLGRRHTAAEAEQALGDAAQAGFDNLSLDLMLAVPGQTRESLAATLGRIPALAVDHVSAYLLKVEPGTPFHSRYGAPDDDAEDLSAALYLDAVAALEGMGLAQYEISNFARPGRESRHNLKYWRGEDYLGIGPAAHSFVEGRRFFFPPDLDAFTAAPNPFATRVDEGQGGGAEEWAMLRLRLREGLNLAEWRRRFGQDPGEVQKRAAPLLRAGLVTLAGEALALTPRGFLLSNAVTAKLLYG